MILVTGGTGLVGSHLLYYLTQKKDSILAIFRSKEKIENVKNVFASYNSEYQKCFLKIQWIQADITDIPSLEKVFSTNAINYVYHCAGYISFNPKEYQRMQTINEGGTFNIVNFCIHHKIKKICYVSSIAAIGNAVEEKIITEENEWTAHKNNSEYAVTKYNAEMEVWRAGQEGVAIVIVNPSIILGSGFNTGSSKLFHQVKKGLSFYTEGVTGFVGVEDVVKIMIQLMYNEIQNERFIISSENKSYKDVLFTIADALQVKRPSFKIKSILTSIAWRINSVTSFITKNEPVLTRHTAKSAHEKEYFSSEKIKKEINYNFENINSVIQKICNTK